MSFKIFSENDLPQRQWSRLTGDSIYASPGFAALWQAMGGKAVFLIDQDDDGTLSAGIAGVIFGRGRLKRFQSMPDGLDGGPIFVPNCEESVKKKFLNDFLCWLKKEKIIKADINVQTKIDLPPEFEATKMDVHLLTLDGRPYQAPRREVRKQVRAAKRREASVIEFKDVSQLEQFYKLVEITEKRHGEKVRYPRDFFEKMHTLSLVSENLKWWIAVYKDNLIASRICFLASPYLFMWQAYSDKDHTLLKSEYLLIDHIIQYAADHNLRYINFGYTPSNAEMLTFFKERWGAEKVSTPHYTYYNWLGKLLYRRG